MATKKAKKFKLKPGENKVRVLPPEVEKCAVHGCENTSEHGMIIDGRFCLPCHNFIYHGRGTDSQAYRNAHKPKEEPLSFDDLEQYLTGESKDITIQQQNDHAIVIRVEGDDILIYAYEQEDSAGNEPRLGFSLLK